MTACSMGPSCGLKWLPAPEFSEVLRIASFKRYISNYKQRRYENKADKRRLRYIRTLSLQASNSGMKRLVLLTIIAFFTVSAYAQPYYRHHHHHHHYYRHHRHAVIIVR